MDDSPKKTKSDSRQRVCEKCKLEAEEEEDAGEKYVLRGLQRFHLRILEVLRNDCKYVLEVLVAEAAAQGIFLKSVHISEEGGSQLRTCTVDILIFSPVAEPTSSRSSMNIMLAV